jgi:hypothetical protein
MPDKLGLTYDKLTQQVGQFLGWGRDNYTSTRSEQLSEIVQSGLRQFYYPPPVGGIMHDWTFLRPWGTILLYDDNWFVDTFPDDFGFVIGDHVVWPVGSSSTRNITVPIINHGRLLEMRATSDTTGRPQYASIMEASPDTGPPQKIRMYFYPTADQDYTFHFHYQIDPYALTSDAGIPHGGPEHAETILESCLAIAEQRFDDAATLHTSKVPGAARGEHRHGPQARAAPPRLQRRQQR